jgi:phosphoribosylanthranilate isomerase
MLVKICGITREQDAHDAVEAGADALGFIFVRQSPRFISPDAARKIIQTLPQSVLPVGVFVDSTREALLDAARQSGIRCLQLHGEETPEDVRNAALPVWKGFRVGPDFKIEQMSAYAAAAYVLDAYVSGRHGGTGTTFDWEVALRAKQYGRIVLSGGITPQNVALAVTTVRPYAIDVSSGVEESIGKKDKAKIRQLIAAINTA